MGMRVVNRLPTMLICKRVFFECDATQFMAVRMLATDKKSPTTPSKPTAKRSQSETGGQLQKSVLEEVLLREPKKPTTFGGKVAEKASNTFLYAVVAASICALGGFVYVLWDQFFSEDSPQKIYSRALAQIRDDPRCQDLFGPTIAGFGEETARGRRRHVAHHRFEKDGRQRIRVKFHIKGERDEGTATVETELDDGEWHTRFLFVETVRRPKTTHVLIDNR